MGQIGTAGGVVTTANVAPTPATSVWGGQLAAADDEFVVRWAGLYLNVNQTAKLFKWDSGVDTDRVKLWVDNRLIIDQWSSLAEVNATAAFAFDAVDALYDVQMEWKRMSGASATLSLPVFNLVKRLLNPSCSTVVLYPFSTPRNTRTHPVTTRTRPAKRKADGADSKTPLRCFENPSSMSARKLF
eukprot:1507814-Rhodomonas_salina.1